MHKSKLNRDDALTGSEMRRETDNKVVSGTISHECSTSLNAVNRKRLITDDESVQDNSMQNLKYSLEVGRRPKTRRVDFEELSEDELLEIALRESLKEYKIATERRQEVRGTFNEPEEISVNEECDEDDGDREGACSKFASSSSQSSAALAHQSATFKSKVAKKPGSKSKMKEFTVPRACRYEGVLAFKNRYRAYVEHNGKIRLVPGLFDSTVEAAVARDEILRRSLSQPSWFVIFMLFCVV